MLLILLFFGLHWYASLFAQVWVSAMACSRSRLSRRARVRSEPGDYEPAGRYYKAYLQRPGQRRTRTPREQAQELDARKSQIRLAMERRDYWQARALCEKLLATAPDNAAAHRYLPHIRRTCTTKARVLRAVILLLFTAAAHATTYYPTRPGGHVPAL